MNGKLIIYSKSGSIIARVEKWEFQDTYMGEQCITFDIKSPTQIPWGVGCYCHYRGETYTLNYIPTITQTARRGESGEAFKYDGVKFESAREELTRIIMLDITATTGDYVASLGTNYTGSSQFSLYCGETVVEGQTRTAVCVLAGKIYANLIRLDADWHIYIDLTSTHKVNGVDVLNTHTDDKTLTFDNTTVQAALEMVNSEFDLDYCVKGRNIYIGYSLDRLTDDGTEEHDFFYFGYGRGMASVDEQGKSLFQIKQTSDSSQKLITRLRALGSTKNLPYRYYNKKYNLSQALFPLNLQLPGTFLELGNEDDEPGTNTKWGKNNGRKDAEGKSYCNAVLGDTNDSYIDKNNDAESTDEGIREDSARWDGSNSELEEIYPTIKEMTYGELRKAGVNDILDKKPTGEGDMTAYVNYTNTERVDEILSFDGLTNYGDGLLAENQSEEQTKTTLTLSSSQQNNRVVPGSSPWNSSTKSTASKVKLFEIENVSKGRYELTPATGNVFFEALLSAGRQATTITLTGKFGLRIYVTSKSSGASLLIDDDGNTVNYFDNDLVNLTSKKSDFEGVKVQALPDAKNSENAQVAHINLNEGCTVVVSVAPYYTELYKNGSSISAPDADSTFTWRIGLSAEQRADTDSKSVAQFWWGAEDSASTYMNTPFYLYIKDFGVQAMQSCFNTSDEPVIAMTSGYCTGREFKIVSDVPEKVVVNGKNCWKVQCARTEDSTLKTYYPSEVDPIAVGDHYVLLNVSMPDSYVQAAEERLLVAATQYLADNCNTKFTYEPSIDNIYLQREYDKYEALGTPEKSIYWKLYAGLRFPFYGIPEADQDPSDVLVDITIQKVTIKEGEGDTPKVEITLNDDVQQTTIQKITTAIDRIYNGSLFGGSGSGSGSSDIATIRNQIRNYGGSLFLSKNSADTAEGHITFAKGLSSKGNTDFGTFNTGIEGGRINNEGDGELKSLTLRESLTVPKLVYNRTECIGGNTWRCAGGGEIDTVIPKSGTTGTATLKLESGEYGMIAEGDICQGIFHLDSGNDTTTTDERNGNFKIKGFKTIYFKITAVRGNNNETFDYELRTGYTTHPQAHMNFACYGNTTLEGRRSSELQTREYTLLLNNVSSWNYSSSNIVLIIGKLDGFSIETTSGTKPLTGSGIAFGKAYMWGTLEQIERVIETFSMKLSQEVIQVQMSDWYDEETKDSVSFSFTAGVVTSQGTVVVPNSITLTPPSGCTLTATPTLQSDNTYLVNCVLEGYIPQEVQGIGAKQNTIGIEINTNASTVFGSIAVIASYQGKAGQDGKDGEDGTGIEIAGSSVGHFLNVTALNSALSDLDDGVVLLDKMTFTETVSGRPIAKIVKGSFICNVVDHTKTNLPTSEDDVQEKGTTYVNADGHLYVAGGEGESWTDCGEIKGQDGADAISIDISTNAVVAKKDASSYQDFMVAVRVNKGDSAVLYGSEGFSCKTLADTSTITTGLKWSFTTSSDNKVFYYKFRLLAGAVVNVDIPYYVEYDGVQYERTLSFYTVEDGAEGQQGADGKVGPMPRMCGTWNPSGQVYYYNDEYRDIVYYELDNTYKGYFSVKHKGNNGTTAGTFVYNVDPTTGAELDSSEWTKASEFKFIAADLMLTDAIYSKVMTVVKAKVEELLVNNLLVTEESGDIKGGFCMSNRTPEGGYLGLDDIRLWLGGDDPTSAPFRVDKDGNVFASSANIKGTVNATDGVFSGSFAMVAKEIPNQENIYLSLESGFNFAGKSYYKLGDTSSFSRHFIYLPSDTKYNGVRCVIENTAKATEAYTDSTGTYMARPFVIKTVNSKPFIVESSHGTNDYITEFVVCGKKYICLHAVVIDSELRWVVENASDFFRISSSNTQLHSVSGMQSPMVMLHGHYNINASTRTYYYSPYNTAQDNDLTCVRESEGSVYFTFYNEVKYTYIPIVICEGGYGYCNSKSSTGFRILTADDSTRNDMNFDILLLAFLSQTQ